MNWTVHDDIIKYAEDKNAIYIGGETLAYLCLEKLKINASTAIGTVLNLSQHNPFGVEIISFTTLDRTKPSVKEISTSLTKIDDILKIEVDGGLEVVLGLGRIEKVIDTSTSNEKYVLTDIVSHLELKISNISFELDCKDEKVVIRPEKADYAPIIKRLLDGENLKDTLDVYSRISGRLIDLEYLNRIEGAMAYSAAQRSIENLISNYHEIEYSKLFPKTKFSGPVNIFIGGPTASTIKNSYNTLILVPESLIVGQEECDCKEIGDGVGEAIPTNSRAEEIKGSVQLGGFKPVNFHDVDLGERALGSGEFGIYLPKHQVDNFGPELFPSIRISDRDNGFIGWKYKANVVFKDVKVELDQTEGGIRLIIEMYMDGDGRIDMEAGPYKRIKIADLNFEQKGSSQVKILFLPALKDGVVYMKPIVERCGFPEFDVEVDINTLLGTPFGKIGQVVIFVMNFIIARSLEMIMPVKLREKIVDTLNDYSWTLLDANYWTKLVKWKAKTNRGNSLYTYYSAKEGSLLISTSAGE